MHAGLFDGGNFECRHHLCRTRHVLFVGLNPAIRTPGRDSNLGFFDRSVVGFGQAVTHQRELEK
jgi:hypothetical protein